jgi:hypothetical protein
VRQFTRADAGADSARDRNQHELLFPVEVEASLA